MYKITNLTQNSLAEIITEVYQKFAMYYSAVKLASIESTTFLQVATILLNARVVEVVILSL